MTARQANLLRHDITRTLLPDFEVEGFKCLKGVRLPCGKATLLMGKNGIGKTAVLEAVRLYASWGDMNVLQDVAGGLHGERGAAMERLFYGRNVTPGAYFSLGRWGSGISSGVTVQCVSKHKLAEKTAASELGLQGAVTGMEISWNGRSKALPFVWSNKYGLSDVSFLEEFRMLPLGSRQLKEAERSVSIKLGEVRSDEAAELCDTAWRLGRKGFILDMLNVVSAEKIVDINVRGSIGSDNIAITFLFRSGKFATLKQLGNGMFTLFCLASAAASVKDGFLLVDNLDFGLHHTVMKDVWELLLANATECNQQIFATTHSKDCAKGLSEANSSMADESSKGIAVRLEQVPERMKDNLSFPHQSHIAVTYSPEVLQAAIEGNSEMR